MMKIIVIGSSGAVGCAALQALSVRHEVITANRSSGDIKIDIENLDSIRSMYADVGKIDAVVSAVGHGYFGPVDGMSSEQFMKGILHKTLPQVNLVLEGMRFMNDGGSFTITSGVLNRDPIRGGASAAAANGALDSFVIGAAVEM
ncbi:MAG: putative NADH-flavin reductase, partial [Gammaproteobacteria bacterium]